MLYIVATPIGNLEDISKRALRTLSEVDLILCEDTRQTKKLLERYQINTQTLSYHQHSKPAKVDEIVDMLKQGKNLALVSEAGTPGISDPGSKLIAELTKFEDQSIKVVPIPGPSALTAAASLAGFSMDKFIFLGFPPVKNKRQKFFKEMAELKYPVILYESPHRIIKTLISLGDRQVVVCRELTKKFETIYRGTAKDILNKLGKEEIKGEFVVIVKRK
ncbi:MAG: 16S rRNA (cytidine(1402)-2'-O)-methyltransferase [Candidatus Nealsonbacteria bacterium]|nr:16S rRNA (cytidine(1402)-2'-O)-methyltransferase [Candidatus Nealsonbacteria bacterium]